VREIGVALHLGVEGGRQPLEKGRQGCPSLELFIVETWRAAGIWQQITRRRNLWREIDFTGKVDKDRLDLTGKVMYTDRNTTTRERRGLWICN
jgi:hypothetical protein